MPFYRKTLAADLKASKFDAAQRVVSFTAAISSLPRLTRNAAYAGAAPRTGIGKAASGLIFIRRDGYVRPCDFGPPSGA